jgi:hypothetical protein
MTDQDLREALRSLPRHRASEGFTRRVLDGCGQAPARRSLGFRFDIGVLWRTAPRRAAVAVALSLLVFAVTVPLALQRTTMPADRLAAEATVTEPTLDESRARLRAELEELKRQTEDLTESWAASSDPVLYVGGDDRVELVLDVDRLAAAQRGRAVPVAHGHSEPYPRKDGSR